MRAKSDVEGTMIPIEFDAIIFQEGKSCVAHCPELDVSSCGHNVDEARGGLKTAVRLFVEPYSSSIVFFIRERTRKACR